ncbi:MAG: hypothetical protein WBQ60_11480 [Asticcacaulis sp.]
MSIRVACLALLSTALLITGCNKTSGDAPANSQAPGGNVATAAGGKSPPVDFMATDACAVVDKAAMAAIVGQAVSETHLGMVSESDGTSAATSECKYTLSNGDEASVMLRWSPIDDNTEESINLTRNSMEQTLKAFGGKVEVIDGLGKAAFWAGMSRSLNVFIGEDKFAIITIPGGTEAKDQATQLAHKLGA